MLSRRSLLSALVAPKPLDRSRLSVITDEVARTPEEAFAFCKQYGLEWIETRFVPGTKTGYWDLPDSGQAAFATQLKEHRLRVSFIDSSLLACPLPGEASRSAKETARCDNRLEELARVIRFAQKVQCAKVRVFSFRRVAEPQSSYPRIAGLLAPMAEIAQREGIQLVLENESSCNVNTCAEIAAIFPLLPASIGLNWDPGNAAHKETAFPDGYRKLPLKRLVNVQVKGKGIIPQREDPIDWKSILAALQRDGYQGPIALETHTPGDRVADSHLAIRELLRYMR